MNLLKAILKNLGVIILSVAGYILTAACICMIYKNKKTA